MGFISMKRVAIIGGGPGGLFAAHQLETSCAEEATITIFEASCRLGGKIVTANFDKAPITFEAGVAELYGYWNIGHDPLRSLIKSLKLPVVSMRGNAVAFGDRIMRNWRETQRTLGEEAAQQIESFYATCATLCTPTEYYDSYSGTDNAHPWASRPLSDLLDELLTNEIARRYVETIIRSDLATEPHLTNALNGLKNILLDLPEYQRYYTIPGGLQQFIDKLAAKLKSTIRLNTPVVGATPRTDGRWDLLVKQNGNASINIFDIVLFALPCYSLSKIEWGNRDLRITIQKHLAHHDYPAHYLRVSVLFDKRFWETHVKGDYWISDAFGGCCVYNETLRHKIKTQHGCLSWLIAGSDALAYEGVADRDLAQRCVESLPKCMGDGMARMLEVKVHHWAAAVSGLPGGNPVHDLRTKHQPTRGRFPSVYLCGDYLADTTVNGALDSADFATDLILTELRRGRYGTDGTKVLDALRADFGYEAAEKESTLSDDYHDEYAVGMSYERSFREYFDEHYTCDLIETIWGLKPPYRLLDCGSASGLTLACFAKKGVEAWGIENNEHIHAQTKPEWKHRNLLGDSRALPFEDGFFDIIYDTSLCYIPEPYLAKAISELFRVTRIGVFFGGITSDMTKEVIEYHEIFEGVQVLETQWTWAERFQAAGFRIATTDPVALRKAWQIEVKSNEGDYPWYPNKETIRFCFFSKPDAAEHAAALNAKLRKKSMK
ncbi:MAG: methyltransferase domain-containing protein [Gammaproteobacteria bacterium]|nr:methyltransferase domain-containing protein [Gammaproteobacteria bacterium]